MATHSANGDAMLQWHAKSWTEDPNPVLTFTLGGTFDLDAIHIWNGIKVVKLRVNSIHDPANPYACLSEALFTALTTDFSGAATLGDYAANFDA